MDATVLQPSVRALAHIICKIRLTACMKIFAKTNGLSMREYLEKKVSDTRLKMLLIESKEC